MATISEDSQVRCLLYKDVFPIPGDDEPDAVRDAAAAWLRQNPVVVNRSGSCSKYRGDLNLRHACRRCFATIPDGPTLCPKGCGAQFCSAACCAAAQRTGDLHQRACAARRDGRRPLVESVPFACRAETMEALSPRVQELLDTAEFQSMVWARTRAGECFFLPCPVNHMPSYASRALATVLIAALGPRPSKAALDACDRGFCLDASFLDGQGGIRRTAAMADFEGFDGALSASGKKHVDIEAALPQEGPDDLLLVLTSGGWPGTEMVGEDHGSGRRWMESVEVAGALRAARAALADFVPGGEGAKLAADVERLFAAVVRHYEGSKLALPLNDAADLSAVAAVELLLRAPALGGDALERTAAGVVTKERVPRGGIVSLLPVLSVFCAGVPARFLEYQWRQGDLIVGDLAALEDKKTTFCHFAIVEDYCQRVFGEWCIFFGDQGHLGTETAMALRRTRALRRALKLSFYAGIWPCLVATADLPKGRVLLPAPPPKQGAAPARAPTATAATPAPPPSPEGPPSSLCAALASSIAEANAQASAERRERRKGGGLGVQSSPTGAPRPLRREPVDVEPLPRGPASAQGKRGRLNGSAQKRQLERQRRANEAFLKETAAARCREEERLQSLEILEIEERMRAAVLEAARKPSKKKGKACCGGVKVPGPVVAQLFCKAA